MTIKIPLIAAVVVVLVLAACENPAPDDTEPANTASADRGAANRAALPPPAPSAEQTEPLEAGDRVPGVTVKDMEGDPVNLAELTARQPSVIIFYRGGWCPYCNTHLGKLAAAEPELVELGYQVLALSPDRPRNVRQTQDEYGYEYRLLSDHEMKAARAFGVAFRVDEDTIQTYQGYGIDLEQASGREHHLLPVPAVFIARTDGVIRYAHANPDYKIRLQPERIVAAAEQALQ